VQPSPSGGETPLADSRKIIGGIDPAIVERFARSKVMYVRNYGEGVDLPWQEVFQTTSKADVEATCRNAALEFEWKSNGRLRTRQICQAVSTHPKTGAPVWFNQAHLFHISRLKPAVRESLLSAFAEQDLPRNVYYGDGSPIESAELDHIGEVCSEVVAWQRGDILLLDNMLTAHGPDRSRVRARSWSGWRKPCIPSGPRPARHPAVAVSGGEAPRPPKHNRC
jgi:hypothetical protein